jgi:hypothetical protein
LEDLVVTIKRRTRHVSEVANYDRKFDANSLYLYAIGENMLCGNDKKTEPNDNLAEDVSFLV